MTAMPADQSGQLMRALSSGPPLWLLDGGTSSSGGLPETVPLPSVPPAADPSLPPSPPRGVAAAMLNVGRLPSRLPSEARRGADHAASPFCGKRPRWPAAGCRAEAETAVLDGSRPRSPFLPRYAAAAPARLFCRAPALPDATAAVGLGRTCKGANQQLSCFTVAFPRKCAVTSALGDAQHVSPFRVTCSAAPWLTGPALSGIDWKRQAFDEQWGRGSLWSAF